MPILFAVAAVTLLVGTDHPNGKWSDRHKINAPLANIASQDGTPRMSDDLETNRVQEKHKDDKDERPINVDVKEVMCDGQHSDLKSVSASDLQ